MLFLKRWMNKMAASENLYGPNNFISKAEAMILKKRKGHNYLPGTCLSHIVNANAFFYSVGIISSYSVTDFGILSS